MALSQWVVICRQYFLHDIYNKKENKKMTIKLETIIENLKDDEALVLANHTYFEESILDEFLHCTIFIELHFFDSNFTEIDFFDSDIMSCTFENCKFNDVTFRDCEFWNSTFSNCTFENCDITRASFEKGEFRNCNFITNNLKASYFSEIEFIETIFKDNNLDLASVKSSKVWKLKQCTEIKEPSYLENFVENTSSSD